MAVARAVFLGCVTCTEIGADWTRSSGKSFRNADGLQIATRQEYRLLQVPVHAAGTLTRRTRLVSVPAVV